MLLPSAQRRSATAPSTLAPFGRERKAAASEKPSATGGVRKDHVKQKASEKKDAKTAAQQLSSDEGGDDDSMQETVAALETAGSQPASASTPAAAMSPVTPSQGSEATGGG